jgi:hypothetical protein
MKKYQRLIYFLSSQYNIIMSYLCTISLFYHKISYFIVNTYFSYILKSKTHEIIHVKVHNNYMILFFLKFFLSYFHANCKEKVNSLTTFIGHIIFDIFEYNITLKDLLINEFVIQYLVVNQVLY